MAGKLSPTGLSSLLSWLASASGPASVQLLARQGVVAGIVAALRPQHLQSLQVLLALCASTVKPPLVLATQPRQAVQEQVIVCITRP